MIIFDFDCEMKNYNNDDSVVECLHHNFISGGGQSRTATL